MFIFILNTKNRNKIVVLQILQQIFAYRREFVLFFFIAYSSF